MEGKEGRNWEGLTPLLQSINDGNIEVARELSKAGIGATDRNMEGRTALDLLAQKLGDPNIARSKEACAELTCALLKAGCQTSDGSNWHLMRLAVESSNKDLFSLLTARGVNFNETVSSNHHPLQEEPHVCIMVNRMLGIINANANGHKTLELKQSFKFVEFVLENGKVDANLRDNKGQTALLSTALASTKVQGNRKVHEIEQQNVLKLAKLLLRHGACPYLRNDDGQAPLDILVEEMRFSESIHVDFVKALLKYGTNPNVKHYLGDTVLYKVISRNPSNKEECVQLLLKHMANPNCKSLKGDTPMHVLASFSHGTSCEVWFKETPDLFDEKDLKIFKLLLKHKADPNIADANMQTPLHILLAQERAYSNKCLAKIVSLLLKYGADPNICNTDMQTPLHILAQAKAYSNEKSLAKIVTLLLKYGADPTIVDADRNTPLHLCKNAAVAEIMANLAGCKSGGKYKMKKNTKKS